MNYKKIIKNRGLRIKILNCLSFIPDKQMIQIQYYMKLGRKVNLKNPKRYTEKVQWYKIYGKDPIMSICADKYTVREYVESQGLGNLLNECYGIYDTPDEVDFEKLPQQFVIKDTLGGGSNDVIICTDKVLFDIETAKRTMWTWVEKYTGKTGGREWVYEDRKHKIIIEKYIETTCEYGLIDYKFYCFNGQVEMINGIGNRTFGEPAEIGFFDENFNLLPVYREDEKPLSFTLEKPGNFQEMIEIAKVLSNDFLMVRVDLYNVKGKIIFGELTFYPGSGYMKFMPDEYDYELGRNFECI